MTEDAINALLDEEITWARKTKKLIGYSVRDNFPGRMCFVLRGMVARIPIGDHFKHETMAGAAYMARAMGVEIITLTHDMRMVRSEDFSSHFKLQMPTSGDDADQWKAGYDRWMADYDRIMKGYDYSIANLPRHLWTELLMTAAKGPEIGTRSRRLPYTRGGGKSVLFLPDSLNVRELTTEINVIPDWWTIPEDDPGLARMGAACVEILEKMEQQKEKRV